MAGFGQEGVHPLSVNAPPLVSSAAPVATNDAVKQLVDSFRNGTINAADVIHSLTVAPAQNKAELAALQASIPQSQLAGAQATAQLPLVGPSAELAGTKIAREAADLKYGGGVSAYQQYAPFFGQPAIIKDANGNPDYDAMGSAGNGYMRTMAQQNFARMLLEPDPARTVKGVDPNTRSPVEKLFNKWGAEVTPGSENYNQYSKVISDTNSAIFGSQPGTATAAPPVAPRAATPTAAPDVSAYSGKSQSELSALLGQRGLMPLSEAATTPPDQAAQILASFDQKQAAPPAPIIQPAAPAVPSPAIPAPGQYIPGAGMVTGPSQNTMAAPAIAEDLRKQPQYDLWAKAAPDVQAFIATADKIRGIPDSQQRSAKADMNTLDMDLAERIIKMEDPGNAIREFKWDKLVQGVPLYDRLKNFKAEALRTGAMTPEKRKQLISLGEEVLAGRERAVKPLLELAQRRAAASGADPGTIFTDIDQRILTGGTLVPSGHGTGQTPGTSLGKKVNIPGRGVGYLDDKGYFTPAP